MNYTQLKKDHRKTRDKQQESLSIRIHRALSWLDKAEHETDEDAKFIFLWVCFNSAYANDFSQNESARSSFRKFIQTILSLDKNNDLYKILFKEFSGLIRVLISNKYIFEPYWKAMREHDSSNQWQEKFQRSMQLATKAIVNKKTETVLEVIFDRLYVLRNQLIHGGATWQSELNRQQVKDGTEILSSIVPVILSLMIHEHDLDMGKIMYPVVA